MRTDDEILAMVNKHKDDFFGFIASDLIPYLSFEKAEEFLKPGAIAHIKSGKEKWEQGDASKILDVIHDYLPFAWEKANDCRGLSANRSIQHFTAWMWLLGDDDFYTFLQDDNNYEYYGKPQLVAISEAVGFDWQEADNNEWRNGETGYAVYTADEGLAKHRRRFPATRYLEKAA